MRYFFIFIASVVVVFLFIEISADKFFNNVLDLLRGAPSIQQQEALTAPKEKQETALGEVALKPDLSLLNTLTASDLAILKRAFAGSPNWFVTEEDQVLTAYLRENAPEGIRSGYNYFSTSELGTSQVKLVFSENYKPNDTWRVQQFDASASEAKVSVYNGNGSPLTYESWILIKGQAPLYIMIYESNDYSLKRAFTVDIVKKLKNEITRSIARKKEIELNGTLKSALLPKSEYTTSLRFDCLMTRCRTGFSIRATFNPMEPGYAILKAIEISSGEPVEIRLNDTKEIMGWSPNPSQLFLYNSNIDLNIKSKVASVRLELWFHPESGQKPRLITAVDRTVSREVCDGEICE